MFTCHFLTGYYIWGYFIQTSSTCYPHFIRTLKFWWNMDEIWMKCGWNVDECGWNVDECGWYVDDMWMICGWYVDEMWMKCGGNVDDMWMKCGWNVDEMWMKCEWNVDEMWTKYVGEIGLIDFQIFSFLTRSMMCGFYQLCVISIILYQDILVYFDIYTWNYQGSQIILLFYTVVDPLLHPPVEILPIANILSWFAQFTKVGLVLQWEFNLSDNKLGTFVKLPICK